MKKTYKISAWVLITIGVLHSVFGMIGATEFNSEILWFISTGILLIVIGGLNLILALRHLSGIDLRAIQIFNLLGVVFISLLVIADPMEVGFLALAAQILNAFGSWNVIRKRLNCCGRYSTT